MTIEEKKEYNRRNYLLHRNDRLAKAKTRAKIKKPSIKTMTATFQPSRQRFLQAKSDPIWERWLLKLLILMMTTFLMREAAMFFMESESDHFLCWFKAVMVEGLVLLLSYSGNRGSTFSGAIQRLLLISICTFNIWAVSGKLFSDGLNRYAERGIRETVIQELEAEIRQKDNFRNQYFEKGWTGVARKYERMGDELRKTLAASRQEVQNLGHPKVIANTMMIAVVFRILIMMANIWCARRYSEINTLKVKSQLKVPERGLDNFSWWQHSQGLCLSVYQFLKSTLAVKISDQARRFPCVLLSDSPSENSEISSRLKKGYAIQNSFQEKVIVS